MRRVSQKMKDGWRREDKTGEYRPIVRATIQRGYLHRFPYDTALADGGDWNERRRRHGTYTSWIFGAHTRPLELRGIKTCSWQRSLDQDVATCTITMKNSELQMIGRNDSDPQSFDRPGYFTYNRAIYYDASGWHRDPDAPENNPWGYGQSGPWVNLLIPDRIVKTYEGYGADYSVWPAEDPNLEISGTWMIDKVTYSANGDIQIEMRDIGRLLLDHICFPPAIPEPEYPLSWSKIRNEQVPSRDAFGGSWRDLKGLATATSSNTAYYGKGLTDPPFPYYVSKRGLVNGHHPNHALDSESTDANKYWMSTGQTSRNSYVWWEMDFDKPQDLAGLRIDPVGGPYRIYISVKTADGWLGRKKIPYRVTTEDIDNGADIPFVQHVWADRFNVFDVILRRKYKNVQKVRLTFTKLTDIQVGNYRWRAMLKDCKAYIGNYDDMYFAEGKVVKVVGNYRDYTDIVKWMCAWGGFYWPPKSTGMDFWIINGDYDRRYVHYDHTDGAFVEGRVWGSFMGTGTYGQADLTVDLFDKKPFMDVINYVRDITGFVFYVDEWGAPNWRLPNIYHPRNFISRSPDNVNNVARRQLFTTDYVTIDEKETLLTYETVLSSENIRDRIFVANATGKVGVTIVGFNPTYDGLRRVGGWTDQNFRTKQETVVMADMIAARQMFDYRRTSVTTPGNPEIQLDDQIRILERVTNETYFHYVLGISSEMNMETGEWIYTLNTHWLGDSRRDAWVVSVDKMDYWTRAYLNTLTDADDQ